MSVGRWQHMSDISVTYQTEDDVMHKVTYCVQLDHHACFFQQAALQDINNSIGWKCL
jgi:hypothetical protein